VLSGNSRPRIAGLLFWPDEALAGCVKERQSD
jgi:hypothetical protein